MTVDKELVAMGKVLEALDSLSTEERQRVLNWTAQKLSIAPISVDAPSHGADRKAASEAFDLSTDTIANILNVNSGSDLAIAAAAHLHFTAGKQKFSRQELTAAMRSAPAHFKETFINNLTKYLASLTKADRLRLVAADTYALSSKQRQQLSEQLSEAQ